MEKKFYDNFNGVRTLAAVTIVFMHVLQTASYTFKPGLVSDLAYIYLYNSYVFVELFFMISGFSLCCGYYERIKNNKMNINDFYSKRYTRILPFFAILVCLDLLATFLFGSGITMSVLYEAYANFTLLFGFLPMVDISVIGVGWTLGVIFGFYIVFPFFVYTLWTKRRAWFWLLVFLGINYVTSVYFVGENGPIKTNTFRFLCFFTVGGILYLYKDKIDNMYNKLSKSVSMVVSVLFLIVGLIISVYFEDNNNYTNILALWLTVKNILAFALILISAMAPNHKVLDNIFTKYMSNISFEIYLSHMLMYRVVEMVGLIAIFGNTVHGYIIVSLAVLAGSTAFSIVFKIIEKKVFAYLDKRKLAKTTV